MNRLRKKSEANYSQSSQGSLLDVQFSVDALPQLTTTNDFRTSLILPDLSRRFSLLRSSTSDPAVFDNHLRTRFADQRARGAINQITEEEEEMLLDALGRIRIKHITHNKSQDKSNGKPVSDATTGGYGTDENGTKGSGPTPATTSISSNFSPSRAAKRYSDNFFGSGRLRDYSYVKATDSSKGPANSPQTVSLTSTEVTAMKMSTSSLLPVAPERTISPTPVQVIPTTEVEADADNTAEDEAGTLTDDHLEAAADVEYHLQNRIGPVNLKRASMAFQQAMKEIEDDFEDQILLPRTTPIPRSSLDLPMPDVRNSHSSCASSVFEGGMAITSDKTPHDNLSERGASPVLTRTVPGYVPGMPRPMTPRNVDLEEQRSHSTTPRAQSPSLPDSVASLYMVSNTTTPTTTKIRRDSTSSITKPISVAPLFLQRSTNGRFTPTSSSTLPVDENNRSLGDFTENDNPLNSSILRRRPASPLAGSSYQSLTIRSNSRPSTPSNVIWTPNSSANGHGRRPSHSRNNSLTGDMDLDYLGPLALNKPGGPRALRSPPLPEPVVVVDLDQIVQSSGTNLTKDQQTTASGGRPQAIIGDKDVAIPPLSSPPRTTTPVQSGQRSSVSPGFGNRSARQNTPSSPFNIGSFPGLGSARANSSRSSLDSVGSSFHSWDEPDKIFSVFSESKEQQVLWHDCEDKSSSATSGDESDSEDVLKRYGGLKKEDIAAIQDKLVIATFMKLANTDPRDRAPSALRRRRPSTSQSNYSRIASPLPQAQPPASPTYTPADDQYSKASALLNSVVESIKDQPSTLNTGAIARVPSSSSEDRELSPATRRNRALARVLFGEEDGKDGDSPTTRETHIKSIPEPKPIASTSSTETAYIPSNSTTPVVSSTAPSTFTSSFLPISVHSSTSQSSDATYLHRNPSVTKVPKSSQEQADLVREVQKKADAAMVALNKTSSSINLPEGLSHSSSIRRRVDPKEISMPKLVSTTTNLDALPLTKLNNNGSSTLGSRFRKLRGSLRVKNPVPSGGEAATPTTHQTPPGSQVALGCPSKSNEGTANSGSASASFEQSRFKVPPQSHTSSGPGLKGFMARFRNKQRMSDSKLNECPKASPTTPTATVTPVTPLSPRSVDTAMPKSPTPPSERGVNVAPRSPGQPRPMYSRFPPANLSASQIPPPSAQRQSEPHPATEPESPTAAQSRAMQQLFRAANDLGLDQNALTDLLSRSGSSGTLLSRNNTVTPSSLKPGTAASNVEPVGYVSSTGSDRTATPNETSSASQQEVKPVAHPVAPVAPEESTSEKASHKPDQLRQPKAGQTQDNPVVRITRIYANDGPDLAGLINRKNSTRRKRVSTASVSSRSVHDRVPTPPPHKAAKRFSADRMPPLPNRPNFLGHGGLAPTNHIQSTYESLYDMYSGESRAVSVAVVDDGQVPPAAQPALEVLELANGETVWNVIKDGDETSIYSHGSIVSDGTEFSQAISKGHSRPESKGSAASFFSSNKKGQQGKSRPETKVFYSTSEQIGRLIESLSHGADAGSFNFLPSIPSDRSGHSKSSSLSTNDITWTVEERLERMIGAINPSQPIG